MSVLSLEACGFAERGQGPRLGLDGHILPTGSIPITTLGGLKAGGTRSVQLASTRLSNR